MSNGEQGEYSAEWKKDLDQSPPTLPGPTRKTEKTTLSLDHPWVLFCWFVFLSFPDLNYFMASYPKMKL